MNLVFIEKAISTTTSVAVKTATVVKTDTTKASALELGCQKH
jgi:hypothetical protein